MLMPRLAAPYSLNDAHTSVVDVFCSFHRYCIMLKSRLNEEKGARNKHFIHDLFSDTTGGRDSRLHAKDASSVRRISEISNTDNNDDDDDENAHDWWMELWDKDDWDTRTFLLSPTRDGGGDAKISLVRLHDEDSIQRAAAAASLLNTQNSMNMDKVNSHGDTRRRTRDAFTTTASQEHKDGNFDALQDTRYDGLYGNTASNHKNDRNGDASISFDTHLNWASTRNPDGVNICHKAHDQVRLCLLFGMRVGNSTFLLLYYSLLIHRAPVVLVGHLQPLEVSKQVPLDELPILPIKPVCGNRI
jgi:hypothetical protein